MPTRTAILMPTEESAATVTNGAVTTAPPAAAPAGDAPFYSTFDDADLKGFAEVNGLKTPLHAVQQLREAQKLIGVPKDELVRVPKADAKQEDWNPIWDRLGRPKEAAEYKLEVPQGDDGEF